MDPHLRLVTRRVFQRISGREVLSSHEEFSPSDSYLQLAMIEEVPHPRIAR